MLYRNVHEPREPNPGSRPPASGPLPEPREPNPGPRPPAPGPLPHGWGRPGWARDAGVGGSPGVAEARACGFFCGNGTWAGIEIGAGGRVRVEEDRGGRIE